MGHSKNCGDGKRRGGGVASQNDGSEAVRYHKNGMRMTKEGYWARCTKRLNLR